MFNCDGLGKAMAEAGLRDDIREIKEFLGLAKPKDNAVKPSPKYDAKNDRYYLDKHEIELFYSVGEISWEQKQKLLEEWDNRVAEFNEEEKVRHIKNNMNVLMEAVKEIREICDKQKCRDCPLCGEKCWFFGTAGQIVPPCDWILDDENGSRM